MRNSSESGPGVGLLYRATDNSMPLVDVAHAAAERGFDALVLGEHTHIPVSRESAFIGQGEMPDTYPRFVDPYIGLAFVAAQTPLKIGTCVSLVAEHDPIALAKALATLDFMSNGRLVFGVGFGWNREELANHGHAWKDRRTIVREYVELMQALWSETEAEYHGQFATLERSWMWPKPVQPSIPVLLGAASGGEQAMKAIVEWCDGWMPGGSNADWLAERLETLTRRWIEAGRSESGPITWALQTEVDDEQLRSQLDRFQAMRIEEVLLEVPTAGEDEILPLLDRYAKAVASSYS